VTAASFLPPTAPIVMPIRSALTDVPAWQTATAVVVMAAAIPAVIAFAGRLYRGGLLHTTGRVRFRHAWHGAA
jgi:ABC-2 type transport system permease protein